MALSVSKIHLHLHKILTIKFTCCISNDFWIEWDQLIVLARMHCLFVYTNQVRHTTSWHCITTLLYQSMFIFVGQIPCFLELFFRKIDFIAVYTLCHYYTFICISLFWAVSYPIFSWLAKGNMSLERRINRILWSVSSLDISFIVIKESIQRRLPSFHCIIVFISATF